ncbi:MAG: 3-methyl-2-oxobutanoate hydroxymethyltransferase [Phycisphaerales bacterium]|nr:3-methyl-2-oxobutanoate hydroxymethyltransferase [Phycisphaerales bacterium]
MSRITIRTLGQMRKRGERFACLTCYDATTAKWLEQAGVHLLLVGDTAAEVILGLPCTIHMPLEIAIALTAAVKRGAPNTVVMADMPFMSYQADDAEALRNAGRFLTEGLADIVKLEADASFAPLVQKMVRAGIPICAHVGSKPQSAGLTGGYASQGRTAAQADQVLHDARMLEDAGAIMLLVEAVPAQVAEHLVAQANVPVIGIGAGTAPDGQILVLQDLLGMTTWQPGFANPITDVGRQIESAAREWIERVADNRVTDHRYEMLPGEEEKLTNVDRSGDRNRKKRSSTVSVPAGERLVPHPGE